MKLVFAEHCAWRATYFINSSGKQVAHIGIDPTASRPNIFGAIGLHRFRVYIPFMHWQIRQPKWKLKWQHFIHGLDGRFINK